MDKVSIIIPARGEKYENLFNTLKSIKDNAVGEYEVIIGFNGEPYEDKEYFSFIENLKIINFPENVGIKGNINALAATATGKYLLKLDAHTRVSEGFDEILKADMEDDWVVTPRFYVLDGKTWKWQDERFYDYFYLSCPFTDPRGLRFKAGGHWPERTKERLESHPSVDETPQIHGSAWFMTKDRFFELGGFPLTDPYGHGQEPLWLGLRNWLQGGKVMVNKNCWYAHLHQNSNERGYPEDKQATEKTYNLTADYFLRQEGFEDFVEKFYPMPTWPDNYKELIDNYRKGGVYLG